LQTVLQFSNPLINGCNIKSDFKSLEIFHENTFDLHSFFYEYNSQKAGSQPISLRRLVFKFFKIDIQKNSHDCTSDALYSVKIYEEIFLKWAIVRKNFMSGCSPLDIESFPFPP
jgi:hypothetical protein